MAKEFDVLKEQANVIKNEVEDGANTASRVGGMFEDIVDRMQYGVTEVNVSQLYPTDGVDGSNKYTLETAIAKVGEELRHAGLKVTFLNEEGTTETWEYRGGSFTSSSSWEKGGAGRIEELQRLGYIFAGVATPSTNPGAPDGPVFYLATEAGIYSNFGGIEVANEEAALLQWNNGGWVKAISNLATIDAVKSETNRIMSYINLININYKYSENNSFITKADARNIVPESIRKRNLIITYYLEDGTSVIEQFIGPVSGWDNEYYWHEIARQDNVDKLNNKVKNINYYIYRQYILSVKDIEINGTVLVYSIIDGQGNIAFGITDKGKVIENIPDSTSNAINNAIKELKQECLELFQAKDMTRDDVFAVIDGKKNVSFLIDKFGNINFNYLVTNNKLCIIDEKGNIALLIDKNGKCYLDLHIEEEILQDYSFPSQFYTVLNDCYSDKIEGIGRTYVPTINIERVSSCNVLFGNSGTDIPMIECFVDTPNSNVSKLMIENSLNGKNYKELKVSTELYTTKNSVLIGKDIRLMCIGDSLTDADVWTSYIGKLINMDNIDCKKKMSVDDNIISYKSVGTIANKGEFSDFTYRGEIVSFIDYNEGRSAWAAATYLRHAYLFTWLSITYNEITKSILHVSWRVLGLYEKYGSEYSGTDEQKELIRKTCNGQYTISSACIDGFVWNEFRKSIGLSNVEYRSADSEQIDLMLHYLDGTGKDNLLDNPINPFFSIDKVKETKDSDNCYAFDFNKYLERYKTHSEDGDELQIKGTNAKDDSYVCTPNFIAMNLGTNDNVFGTSDSAIETTLRDVLFLSGLLKESTGAKMILFQNAYPTSDFPELSYYRKTVFSKKNNSAYIYRKKNDILKRELGTLSQQITNGIFYCPSFYSQRQSCHDRVLVDIGTENEIGTIVADNNVHPDKLGYADIGYEVYSLLCYLLTL